MCSSSTPREGRKEREVIKESTYRSAGVKSWRSAPVSTKSDTHIDDEQAQLEIVQRLFVRLRNALVGCFRLRGQAPGAQGLRACTYHITNGAEQLSCMTTLEVLGCHSAARTARQAASRRSPRGGGGGSVAGVTTSTRGGFPSLPRTSPSASTILWTPRSSAHGSQE